MINVDVRVKKSYNVWNPATCNCENGKNSASIIDDSVIMSDETIDKKVPKIKLKIATWKTQNLYILLEFLLIAIALLIAVSIYCYLI